MTDLLTINTENLRGEIAPLYSRYQGQINAQPAYVELDEDGNVSADYSGEIGNAVPMTVWHRRTLRWSVSNQVRGDELADLLESDEVVALLERVYLGHTVEWDGNNHTGSLDDDARAASDELDTIFGEAPNSGNDGSGVWDAGEWLDGAGLLGSWSGKPLDEAVSEIQEQAESDSVYLDGDVETVLLEWAETYVRDDKPGLDANHLRALTDADRINAEDIAEYADDHDIEFQA